MSSPLTPVQKFKFWLKTSPGVVTEVKEEAKQLYKYTDNQVEQKVNSAIWWLMKNEGKAKANKRDWRRYLMNFLQPKEWEKKNDLSRRTPSSFE